MTSVVAVFTGIGKDTEDAANLGFAVAHAVAVWLEPVQTSGVAGAIKCDIQSLTLEGKRAGRAVCTASKLPSLCSDTAILIGLPRHDLLRNVLKSSQDTHCLQKASRSWRMLWPRGRGRTAPGTATTPSTP